MARITIEDCLRKINNRFKIIEAASRRARNISDGAESLVDVDNDKPPVIALREIAAGLVDLSGARLEFHPEEHTGDDQGQPTAE